MNTTNRKNILLGAGLLGISTALGIANPALAAPRNNDVRREQRDVQQARREVREEKRDLRQANTPAQRRDARDDLKDARRDLKDERRDLRQERRDNNWNNHPNYNNHPGYNNRPVYNNRPIYNNQPGFGSRPNFGRTYTGFVTNVRSNQSFDINIGGNTFNVYTINRLPLSLSVGDQVRVNGVQQYSNDIRNATATVIRNR